MMASRKTVILGAGITGLSAGIVTGLPIFEALDHAGGICSSYYIRPGDKKRLMHAPNDSEAYRFEKGGGHWIFGGNTDVRRFMRKFTSLNEYKRRASVYFQNKDLYVPYPLQNHLRFLDTDIAEKALVEISAPRSGVCLTMKQWLERSFGPTLCDLFFSPFHELYTAGLYDRIAPQDSHKSPVDIAMSTKGAFGQAPEVGYNITFLYPETGLDALVQRIAKQCDIRYCKRINAIDVQKRELFFDDGETIPYEKIISTLPLNEMIHLCNLSTNLQDDPYSSVLVLNIGAVRGEKCPDAHWLYNTSTLSGFHRVGFYSNVDRSFLPVSSRKAGDKVSIYVEKAYAGGKKPTQKEIAGYTESVIKELQSWDFIGDTEVSDSTWINVAYTWSWPGSKWKDWALIELDKKNIHQVGRYACWKFQGIADSIKDGLVGSIPFQSSFNHSP